VEKVDWKIELGAGVFNPAGSLRLAGLMPAAPVKKLPVNLIDEGAWPGAGTAEYTVKPQPPEMALEITGLENPVMEFSPDGRHMLAAGYGNYTVRLYETAGWSVVKEFKASNRPVSIAAFDGYFVMSDAYGGFTTVKTLSFGGEPERVSVDGSVQPKVYASSNGKFLASVTFDKKFAVFDMINRQTTAQNTMLMPRITCGAFWPAGPYFFAGTDGPWFVIWDLAKGGFGRSYHISKVTKCQVTSISFSPDGKYFVTTHNDSSIVFFETATQKELRNWYVRDKGTMASAYSPDGRFFATSNGRGWVYFWSAPDCRQLAAFELHKDMVLSLKFMPGEPVMATAGNDHAIRLWNMQ
jgi:WD40 repeat protein